MRASKSSFTMVLIRFTNSFTIPSRVLFPIGAFPPFFSNLFWEACHTASRTQFLRHYPYFTLKVQREGRYTLLAEGTLDILRGYRRKKWESLLQALRQGIYMNCLPVKYLGYQTIKGIMHGLRKIEKISGMTLKKEIHTKQYITGARSL